LRLRDLSDGLAGPRLAELGRAAAQAWALTLWPAACAFATDIGSYVIGLVSAAIPSRRFSREDVEGAIGGAGWSCAGRWRRWRVLLALGWAIGGCSANLVSVFRLAWVDLTESMMKAEIAGLRIPETPFLAMAASLIASTSYLFHSGGGVRTS